MPLDTPLSRNIKCELAFSDRMLANASSGARKFLSRNEAILLELLLKGPQRKDVVVRSIWGSQGIVVTDGSYYQLVAQLRKSFDKIGLPRLCIQTIPRYGLELVIDDMYSHRFGCPYDRETSDAGIADKCPADSARYECCVRRCLEKL